MHQTNPVKLANWQNEQNEMVDLANLQNEQNEMVKLANWQNEQNEKCLCRFSHSAHSAGRMIWYDRMSGMKMSLSIFPFCPFCWKNEMV